jgi:glycolate oxidase FAD binding subunit
MRELLTPRDEADLVEIVAAARSAHSSLAVEGRGTRARLGHAVEAERAVSLAAMTGITLYEPAELVLTARAGTPLSEIEAALAANGQELAFEPMDHSAIFGTAQRSGSIAGMVAVNASGPRRIKSGAARDHLLGFRAVNGLAQSFKSGGRVMKNVTGFDLSRGLSGSWGTLAVFTELTLKVLPRAEASRTLTLSGLTPEAATQAMAAALGSSADVSGAAHLPEDGLTALRLEGTPVSIAARQDRLAAAVKPFGSLEARDGGPSEALWRDIRDMRPFWPDRAPDMDIWRVSVAPSDGWRVAADVAAAAPATRVLLDWQGGLVWLAVPAATPVGVVRAAVAARGSGHATCVRTAPDRRDDAFAPLAPAAALLARRLKDQFDPDHVLEPGRMGSAF